MNQCPFFLENMKVCFLVPSYYFPIFFYDFLPFEVHHILPELPFFRLLMYIRVYSYKAYS